MFYIKTAFQPPIIRCVHIHNAIGIAHGLVFIPVQGVTLYKDSEGSIWAKRLSRYDVIVKGHDDPGNHCLSADLVLQNGHLPYQQQVKVRSTKGYSKTKKLYFAWVTAGVYAFLHIRLK